MIKKEDSVWVFLQNALVAISSQSADLQRYQSSTYDFLDDIETNLYTGFREENLDYFIHRTWMRVEIKSECIRFRDFVLGIEESKWSIKDFDYDSDWEFVRR